MFDSLIAFNPLIWVNYTDLTGMIINKGQLSQKNLTYLILGQWVIVPRFMTWLSWLHLGAFLLRQAIYCQIIDACHPGSVVMRKAELTAGAAVKFLP